MTAPATADGAPGGGSASERFARVCAQLGVTDPEWCSPRRAAVLSALRAASLLTPTQVRTMVRAQHPRLLVREHGGRTVRSDGDFRVALTCLREEARVHGRLGALGQAWAASNQLTKALTARQPPLVSRIVASSVSGEVLCRVLDDVEDRRVLSAADEQLLRHAWRAAYPPPAYFRRPRIA